MHFLNHTFADVDLGNIAHDISTAACTDICQGIQSNK